MEAHNIMPNLQDSVTVVLNKEKDITGITNCHNVPKQSSVAAEVTNSNISCINLKILPVIKLKSLKILKPEEINNDMFMTNVDGKFQVNYAMMSNSRKLNKASLMQDNTLKVDQTKMPIPVQHVQINMPVQKVQTKMPIPVQHVQINMPVQKVQTKMPIPVQPVQINMPVQKVQTKMPAVVTNGIQTTTPIQAAVRLPAKLHLKSKTAVLKDAEEKSKINIISNIKIEPMVAYSAFESNFNSNLEAVEEEPPYKTVLSALATLPDIILRYKATRMLLSNQNILKDKRKFDLNILGESNSAFVLNALQQISDVDVKEKAILALLSDTCTLENKATQTEITMTLKSESKEETAPEILSNIKKTRRRKPCIPRVQNMVDNFFDSDTKTNQNGFDFIRKTSKCNNSSKELSKKRNLGSCEAKKMKLDESLRDETLKLGCSRSVVDKTEMKPNGSSSETLMITKNMKYTVDETLNMKSTADETVKTTLNLPTTDNNQPDLNGSTTSIILDLEDPFGIINIESIAPPSLRGSVDSFDITEIEDSVTNDPQSFCDGASMFSISTAGLANVLKEGTENVLFKNKIKEPLKNMLQRSNSKVVSLLDTFTKDGQRYSIEKTMTRISPPRAHDAPPPAISSERVLQILQQDIQKCVMYDDEGFLPIHRAVLENNLKLVKRWLMAMKFHNDSDPLTKDERYSCLQLAVLYEVSPGIFSSLLSAGCCPLSSQACDLPSALHLAAQHHDPIPLQTLLDCMDKGCNINVGDDNGDTPLITAVKHQRVENMLPLLEYVEESRASQLVNFPNLKTGFTPLAMVANINMTSYGEKDLTEESKNIIRILHRYGADPEHEDFKGNAVLGNSCKEKNNKFEAFWESLEGNSI